MSLDQLHQSLDELVHRYARVEYLGYALLSSETRIFIGHDTAYDDRPVHGLSRKLAQELRHKGPMCSGK